MKEFSKKIQNCECIIYQTAEYLGKILRKKKSILTESLTVQCSAAGKLWQQVCETTGGTASIAMKQINATPKMTFFFVHSPEPWLVE